MRSEGSRFTLWFWGQGCVRQLLCLRAQPSAWGLKSSPHARMHLERSRKWVKLNYDAVVIYWHLHSRCLSERSVSPQLYRRLRSRCLSEWSVSIGVCRGGVCVSFLCRRSYNGVCTGGVSVSALRRRSFYAVSRGSVCVSDLCRRSFFGVCRGGVCVSDLRRRSYLAFAEEVSVWVICAAAVILAFKRCPKVS